MSLMTHEEAADLMNFCDELLATAIQTANTNPLAFGIVVALGAHICFGPGNCNRPDVPSNCKVIEFRRWRETPDEDLRVSRRAIF